MQTPTITASPSSPLTVVEGQNVTLEWWFNLAGNQLVAMGLTGQVGGQLRFRVQIFLDSPNLVIDGDYTDRITVNVSDTFTSITLLAMNRTDSNTYDFTITSSEGQSSQQVEIIVQFPASLTARAGDQALVEGEPATFSTNTKHHLDKIV